jgi:hypothetical protein
MMPARRTDMAARANATGSPTRPALPAVDFAALSPRRLAEMSAAGAEVVEWMRVLSRTGDNVVGELLRGTAQFLEWDHYPGGDVYDGESHAQYYYHAHPQELRPGEHGHFHTFLRPRGMPDGVRPAARGGAVAMPGENDALSHLIAISMNAYGVPIRLFATNRWVTGETWYAAADVRRMLDRFVIGHARPSWPANRWIGAMLRLFRPQIEMLLDARDAMVAAWATAHPGRDVLEDRALEIAATVDISIDAQNAAVAAALARRR